MPRSISADIDVSTSEKSKSLPYGSFFNPDNYVFLNSDSSGATSTNSNYARGHYEEGN